MKGVEIFLEEVEEGVDAIKGTKFEEGAKREESKKDGKGEDELWMIGLGDDSDPVKVTRTEYLTKNLSKRMQTLNPNVSGGPWTPYEKGQKQRRMVHVLSNVNETVYLFHTKLFKQWYEKGLEGDD